MEHERFAYHSNLDRSFTYQDYTDAYWPPAIKYITTQLELASARPDLGAAFPEALAELASSVNHEWCKARRSTTRSRTQLHDSTPAARAMRHIAACLPHEADRRAAALRADVVEHGYDQQILKELAEVEEDIAVVVGQLATWYGKDTGGFPTAFACQRDDRLQRVVTNSLVVLDAIPGYLRQLHPTLRLGDVPVFVATNLFFMAGEGNLHPKHIAYFLPEDEGVKNSPFNKTYYFGNTHMALLETMSTPLAARFADVGSPFEASCPEASIVSTLGVLGHEFGHFVYRDTTSFEALHSANRWASAVLQEVLADVFGTLILAEVWAERSGLDETDVVSYYLAECLRYVNRGLGLFPDSDGMYLQLSYLAQVGALTVDEHDGRLRSDPGAVIAGLRSLARVLTDAVLNGREEAAIEIYETFGPAGVTALAALTAQLAAHPPVSVEYLQETSPLPAPSVS